MAGAIRGLSSSHERGDRIVELKYFGGLTKEDIAEVVGISSATVTRRYRTPRAWLYAYLAQPDAVNGLI